MAEALRDAALNADIHHCIYRKVSYVGIANLTIRHQYLIGRVVVRDERAELAFFSCGQYPEAAEDRAIAFVIKTLKQRKETK
jgi:hypothetical protein